MVEAKHEFIDDNPYLVYSPDAEATAGGSGGFSLIEEDFKSRELNITADELVALMKQSIVIVYEDLYDGAARQYLVSSAFAPTQSGGYQFSFIATSGKNVINVVFVAESGSSKPVGSD